MRRHHQRQQQLCGHFDGGPERQLYLMAGAGPVRLLTLSDLYFRGCHKLAAVTLLRAEIASPSTTAVGP